jgi:serine/threonine protein kinase/predicted Zn-dependent protease
MGLRKLGKYEVLGELGHGAMGVVYRARDPIINRMVALKTITTGLAEDANLLQRFYREAQSAGGLQHPNIVTIYDMGDEQKTPYIAMELIDGESLEQMIARRVNVPLAIKLTYALQACRAFEYAHKRGIVHRDIKPGNVMVNKEGVVKVVDFGIARVLDTSKTQTGLLIGTFAYMSPEQYSGEHADERSDIWSFGVLLYELLYYERPFTGDNPASLMHSICSQEPRFPSERVPNCPPAMESMISKILRKSPQERFQSMEDLLLELEPLYKEVQQRSIAELVDRSRELVERSDFGRAREILRELLKVDPTNVQARALLEKVNIELKRLLIRPRVQQQVDKGQVLLKEGKIQEARGEAESALQLDSSFEPAQELVKEIQREVDRARMVAEWLQTCGQRVAEGLPDEAEELLAKVLEMDPANKQAKLLEQQVVAEKAERQRRSRLLGKTREARELWTRLNYEGCIAILKELEKEFPGEEEIQRLLDTVREDQAEHHKQETLEGARNLLAAGNYAESKALLVALQERFPGDEEIPRLLEDIRLDESKQHRLQALTEARDYLANRQYEECIRLLTTLEKEFPQQREILQLLELARADQAEQQKQQRVAQARGLLTARRHDECAALLEQLQAQFPADKEISELREALQAGQREQRRQESVTKAGSLVSAKHWEEAMRFLAAVEKEFPGDEEVSKLLTAARTGLAEQQRQQGVAEIKSLLKARRYEESGALAAKWLGQFPNDSELQELEKAVRAEFAEQQRQQGIAEIKSLLKARRYEESGALAAKWLGQFPNDSDILELQKSAREEQRGQQKLANLTKAQELLASKSYEKAIAILTETAKEFPNDEAVGRLLGAARDKQEEERKQQGLAEARNLLAARRYDDCAEQLEGLEKQFPKDPEIQQMQAAVRQNRAEQEKLERLAGARKLLAAGNYNESGVLLGELEKRFPNDQEISRLLTAVREGLAEERKSKRLAEGRRLLAAGRYDESVSLLTELKKEFPEERGIARLLANASEQQFEQQRQQKLAEGRALLAAQRFSEALELLDAFGAAHPKDSAVQKLRALVERERDKQSRSERLQQALEALKKLLSEKKYAELLARAEPLRADFPANTDLLRLIDFARGQQTRIENETRLRTAVDNVKAQISENRFREAIETAQAGLKAFPKNAELVYLREQAEAREKKQWARGMIEQRIREIKFKINRQDLSDAVSLAKETIAAAGPDTDLTHLLNSATVELEAREKKRQQEQKLQEIRTLVDSGHADGAAQTLKDAVEAEALDTFDPRVTRLLQQIEAAKTTPSVGSPAEKPSTPANFYNEYAFLQGRPLEVEPPPVENVGRSETSTTQASTTQSVTPSRPSSIPPPQHVAPSESKAPEVVPGAERPPVPFDRSSTPGRVEAPVVREQPRERGTETAATPRPAWRRASLLSAIVILLSLGLWAAVHFVGSRKTAGRVATPVPSTSETAGSHLAVKPNLPSKPSVSPAELQERNAIATADKLIASGELKRALEELQSADKLNGPLTDEIKSRETAVAESMRNASLAKLRQQEAKLWTRATAEADQGQFSAARRDLKQIIEEGQGGIRKSDAQKYLNDVIPKRQQEENLFRQARANLRASDQQGLQHTSNLLEQVIALDGPRKAQAEALEQDVGKRLADLKQETARRQVAALEDTARSNIRRGDFAAARQNAKQIKQAGGDAAALLNQIDLAQASQARAAEQQKEFQRAVESYGGVGSRDRSGLEKSRADFLAIARGNGPRTSDAQRYVADIDRKLEALNQPPPPTAPAVEKAESNTAVEEAAVREVIGRFFQAFEQRNANSLSQVWPTIPRKSYDGYKNSFLQASAISMRIAAENVKIGSGDATATVTAQSEYQYTPKGQPPMKRLVQSWTFELAKRNGMWVITAVH